MWYQRDKGAQRWQTIYKRFGKDDLEKQTVGKWGVNGGAEVKLNVWSKTLD